MDQPIASGNDKAPGNLVMERAHGIRDMRGSFSNELDVPQYSIISEAGAFKSALVETRRVCDYLLSKADHIVQIDRQALSILSDTYRLFLDVGPELGTQSLFSDKIHGSSKKIFQVELNAKIPLRCCRSVEANKHIHIAIVACGIPYSGTKKSNRGDAITLGKNGLAFRQYLEGMFSGHFGRRFTAL